jgi:integrase/recombinase XerD
MDIKDKLKEFIQEMRLKELTERTLKKYESDINQFIQESNISEIDQLKKEILIDYKAILQSKFKTASINNKITIINKFIDWLDLGELKLKQIKQQRKTSLEDVLNDTDYNRLLRLAERLEKFKILNIMKTLAGTGIRIDELKYITVEAIKKGYTKVENKGKIRDIIISKNLSKELKSYCKEQDIKEGIIFISNTGKPLDKAYIWRELQYVAGQAKVKKSKVHAHSFRHLFAKTYLRDGGNITHLADLLGHSSLDTTRIYTMQTKDEHRAILDSQEEARKKRT